MKNFIFLKQIAIYTITAEQLCSLFARKPMLRFVALNTKRHKCKYFNILTHPLLTPSLPPKRQRSAPVGYAAEYPIPVFLNVCKGFMGGKISSIKSASIIAFYGFFNHTSADFPKAMDVSRSSIFPPDRLPTNRHTLWKIPSKKIRKLHVRWHHESLCISYQPYGPQNSLSATSFLPILSTRKATAPFCELALMKI